MHFRDCPNSLNGLGIPGNIWFRRYAVTYTVLYTRINTTECRGNSLPGMNNSEEGSKVVAFTAKLSDPWTYIVYIKCIYVYIY